MLHSRQYWSHLRLVDSLRHLDLAATPHHAINLALIEVVRRDYPVYRQQ